MARHSETAMSWFRLVRRDVRHGADQEGDPPPPPFPTLSTFLGIAAVMIVLWLLAYGPPHLNSASDRSVPSNNIDTGASK